LWKNFLLQQIGVSPYSLLTIKYTWLVSISSLSKQILIVPVVIFKMCKAVLVAIFSLAFYPGIKSQCSYTNSKGPAKNVACVFPFTFNKVIYNSCTKDYDPDGLFW
jgi:Fibronectin type II domain